MKNFALSAILLATLAISTPVFAAGMKLQNTAFREMSEIRADGQRKISLVGPGTMLPGNTVVFVTHYSNEGTKPAERLVINSAVPAGTTYLGPNTGVAEPLVSIDAGRNWGFLQSLRVGSSTASRQAQAADVTNVRWLIAGPISPGANDNVSYRALIK